MSWLSGTWLVLILSAGVPMIIIGSTPPSNLPWEWAVLICLIAGFRYAALVKAGSIRPYELIFWLFVYAFMGLAPLVQMRLGTFPSTTPGIKTDLLGTAVAIVILGLAAFVAGFLFDRKISMRPQAGQHLSPRSSRTYKFAILSLIFSIYYIQSVGIVTLFGTRDALTIVRSQVWADPTISALVTALGTIPLLTSVIALQHLHKNSKGRTSQIGNRTLLGVCVTALLIAVNPLSNPRYIVGTVLLALMASFGALANPRRFRITALAAMVGILAVFPYADIARHQGQSNTLSRGGPLQTLTSGDFDAFAQIDNTAYFVDRFGTTNGEQALGVVLFWVPRQIWSDKPPDTGVLVARSRGYVFENLSAPIWSELYINGGWAALILGMFVFGLAVRRRDGLMVATGQLTGMDAVLPFYLLILLRGSLLQAMVTLGVLVSSTWFVSGNRPFAMPYNRGPENAEGARKVLSV